MDAWVDCRLSRAPEIRQALILICLGPNTYKRNLTRGRSFQASLNNAMGGLHESSVNPRSFAQPPHVEAISMPTNLINNLSSNCTVSKRSGQHQSSHGEIQTYNLNQVVGFRSSSDPPTPYGFASAGPQPPTIDHTHPSRLQSLSFTKPPVPELAMIHEPTRSRSLRLGLDWPDWA